LAAHILLLWHRTLLNLYLIEAELRREQAVRKNLTKESVCEMQNMFEEEI